MGTPSKDVWKSIQIFIQQQNLTENSGKIQPSYQAFINVLKGLVVAKCVNKTTY